MKRLLLVLVVGMVLVGCSQKHSFVFQDQTVTDVKTKLVWSKNANMAGKPLLWKSDDNVYAFIKKLNDEGYANYYDWRLPTKDEMSELVAYAKELGYDANKMETWPYQKLGQLGFLNVRDYDYWTATRETKDTMWIANMVDGSTKPKEDTKPYFVWPVRGGGGH